MRTVRIAVGLVSIVAAGAWAGPQGAVAEGEAAPSRANIVGVVHDATGASVSGASIEVRDGGGRVVKSATSSRAGGYEIPCLALGEYTLQLDPGTSQLRGEKVVASLGAEGLRVDWTVAPDKPALARAQPGGGVCGAVGAEGSPSTAVAGDTVAVGAAGGALVIGGTAGGLAASGAFDGGTSGSSSQ